MVDSAGISTDAIAVIGAGLSGLTAAVRLQQWGHAVVVLEANDRVGGRASSSSQGWVDGQHADLGGELIDGSYKSLISLCEEVGVELSEPVVYAHRDADATAVERYLRTAGASVGGVFLSEEDRHSVADEVRRAIRLHAPFQQETAEQWITRARLSARAAGAVRGVVCMLTQNDSWEVDGHYLFGATNGEFRRVVGGTQRLAEALAAQCDVRLGSVVQRVRQRHGRIQVELADGSHIEVPRAICAVGPFVLTSMGFDPPLSEHKVNAMATFLPGLGGKVVNQYEDGDAVRAALTTVCVSDGVVNAAWVSNPYVTQGPAMVTGLVSGRHRHVLGDHDAAAAALDEIVSAAVGAPTSRARSLVKNWSADPHTYGVTVNPPLLSRGRACAVAAQPDRRLHFAGDYTDEPLCGTLEGAVRSGVRAALEIDLSPPRYDVDTLERKLVRS